MNPINHCLHLAYEACAHGRHAHALEHLRDAADLAFLANDRATHAACIRAYVQVVASIGHRHLERVQ
jgi:hypothetical protein